MILKLHKTLHDANGMRISYSFVSPDGTEFAAATNNIKEHVMLYFNGEEYVFWVYPKIVQVKPSNFIYPLSSKLKRMPGFKIMYHGEMLAYYYSEALTCEKKRFFKRNICATAFVYQDELYYLFQVGFWPKEMDHYYCLYQGMNLVGMVQRHNRPKDNCIATVYIENTDYILINLLACVEKLVYVSEEINPSLGPYKSRYEEEKALVDRSFMERVKEMESVAKRLDEN